MDPGSVQAVFPQVRGQFGRSRCPGQTTVDQVVSTRGPEAWSRRRQAWSWSWTGIGGPVVMHHVPVTLGAAWWVGLGLGVAWCWTGRGAAWHWWWARHLHRLGGVTCMFVISLTFWVSIGGVVGISFWWCLGWWEGVLGVSRPLSGCDLSVADGSVRTASGSGHIRLPDRRDQSIPPRSGRETGPGSRSLPGLSAGGDPPGSGCHSYPGPRS